MMRYIESMELKGPEGRKKAQKRLEFINDVIRIILAGALLSFMFFVGKAFFT